MRIYLSGPMTGMPEMNFPAFHATAERIRALGHQVINPAEINPADTDKTWHECMRDDLREMLSCDCIALLDGWTKSDGAMLELQIAHRLGLEVVFAHEVAA